MPPLACFDRVPGGWAANRLLKVYRIGRFVDITEISFQYLYLLDIECSLSKVP
jgi:hypothetical protein